MHPTILCHDLDNPSNPQLSYITLSFMIRDRLLNLQRAALDRLGLSSSSRSSPASATAKQPAMAWVIPQQLAVGRLPRSADLALLQQQGIQTIVSLCHSREGCLPPQASDLFEVVSCPLPDQRDPEPLTVEQLRRAVMAVGQQIRQGRRVYVHCLVGLERSPTVCITYLCQRNKVEIWEALQFLREAYPAASPTSSQLQIAQACLRSFSGAASS